MKKSVFILTLMLCSSVSYADTTSTTDSNETTTVEETSTDNGAKLIGPTGVTGTIRRADRRQDRRLENDIEEHTGKNLDLDLDRRHR